jgi:hypothetical protein
VKKLIEEGKRAARAAMAEREGAPPAEEGKAPSTAPVTPQEPEGSGQHSE